MATAYAECYLCMKHQKKDTDGSLQGGIMYVLEHGVKKKTAGKMAEDDQWIEMEVVK